MASLLGRKSRQSDKAKLRRKLDFYWSRTAYVTDSERLGRMREQLTRAQQHLNTEELPKAAQCYYLAKREFILARQGRQVYYYRSPRGMYLAVGLAFAFTIGILGLWLEKDSQGLANAPILAALGGGIGGCAAVLIQAIDVEPESETVSQTPWYFIKPILGGALGLITFFAVASGLNVIADGAQVTSFEGAVVVGFLAGFFESFSTGVLARAAGQLAEKTPIGSKADAHTDRDIDAQMEILVTGDSKTEQGEP